MRRWRKAVAEHNEFNFSMSKTGMEAGLFTEHLRNRALHEFYRQNPNFEGTDKSHALVIQRTAGGQNLFDRRKLIHACCPCTDDGYNLTDAVLVGLEAMLQRAASSNWGPTIASRILYLWFHTVVSGYNWVSETVRITGTKDNWNWDTKYVLGREGQFIWMNHLLATVMPTFIPGYDASFLLEQERQELKIDAAKQISWRNNVRATGHWNEWLEAWNTWYTLRSNDGSGAALAPPSDSELPNGVLSLIVDNPIIDPNVFPQPRSWTPLVVNETRRNYLTYNWGSVASSCLTADDETAITAMAAGYFPNTIARDAEIAEIALLTGALTDEQKCLAEFWAGGPFTASPPGILLWMWKEYAIVRRVARSCSYDAFFYSGFDLAQHLFEAGRVVWGLKKLYMQSRPIQDIRRLYRLQGLTAYDGTPTQGESWIPYQESDFVTPPFADFPSGHSTYSQVFASVMMDWFGYNVPESEPRLLTDLNLVSPTFQAEETFSYGRFVFGAGRSTIQPGVVPAQPITLRWDTWQQLADSAGLSRKYGGIHATSAHTGGQAVAHAVHLRIRTRMGLAPSF